MCIRKQVLRNPATGKYVMWLHVDATQPGSATRSHGLTQDEERERKHLHDKKKKGPLSSEDARRYAELKQKQKSKSRHKSGQKIEAPLNVTNETRLRRSLQDLEVEDEDEKTEGETDEEGDILGSFHQKYWLRRAAVAEADRPEGPFVFKHILRPDGLPSLDLQLFQESSPSLLHWNKTDKNAPLDAYLIRSADNQFVGISRLTEDYLNTSGIVSTYRPALEGMAVFRIPNGSFS